MQAEFSLDLNENYTKLLSAIRNRSLLAFNTLGRLTLSLLVRRPYVPL